MSRNTFRYLTLVSLILVLLATAACGGPPPPPPDDHQEEATEEHAATEEASTEATEEAAMTEEAATEEAGTETEATEEAGTEETTGDMTGAELLDAMVEAMKATDSVEFTAEFQSATVEGGVNGTLHFIGQRPSSMFAKVTSEDPDLNGLTAVTNDEMAWAYSEKENFVLVADKSQYKTQLNEEPEVREILDSGERIVDRGFDETTLAENMGTEEMDGLTVHKVQVEYDKANTPDLDLEGVTTIYYIDAETMLPHRIEITLEDGEFSANGYVLITEIETGGSFDAETFVFEPPADAAVMDLEELMPPKFEVPEEQ